MPEARKDPAFGSAGDGSVQIQSHLSSKEDQKERLQDALADLLLQPAEEDIDSDALDALLDALDEIDPVPENEMLDTEESLKRFHERYASLFPAVEEPPAEAAETSPEKRHSRFTAFKVALIAAVLVFAVGSVAAQAFGMNVFGTIARWSSETFRMQSEEIPYATIRTNPLSEDETAFYDTLQDAVDAFGITEPLVPQWIPDRFTLVEVKVKNRSDSVYFYANYEDSDESLQIQYKETTDFDFHSLEKEPDYMGLYVCKKINHYLMFDKERWKACWQNGELECRISGHVSEQEIKDIIESIY